MRYFILVCMFFSSATLFSQNEKLRIFNPERHFKPSELPTWIEVVKERSNAFVVLKKECPKDCFIDIQWGDFEPVSVGFSKDKSQNLEVCLPILARCFSDKMRDDGQVYALDNTDINRSDFSTDFSDLWAFKLGARGSFSEAKAKDAAGFNESYSSMPDDNFSFDLRASRVGLRWRYLVEGAYSLRKQPFGFTFGQQDYYKNLVINGQIGFRVLNRLSLGFGARYNNSFISSNDRSLDVLTGLEYNIFPYRDFFKKRFIFGYSIGNPNVLDSNFIPATSNNTTSHSFFAKYALFKDWGYIDINAFCRLNRSKSGSRFPFPFDNTSNTYEANIEYGLNLSSHLWLTTGVRIAHSKSKYSTSRIKNFSYAATAGINYYFGKGGRNVVNTRMF